MKKKLIKMKKNNLNHIAVGFVLVDVAPTHEQEVHKKLAEIPQILELYALFGEHDLIAKIEAQDFETLGHVIINKIRSIEGVIDTHTLTATKVLVDRNK